MRYTLFLFLGLLTYTSPMIFDFGKEKDGADWMIVNDGVMGGLSRGKIEYTENSLIFSGSVSLENNGGFTSFRSPYSRYDLAAHDKIEIKYRSKGLDCALSIDQYRRFWRPNHKMSIPSSKGEWVTVTTSLSELGQYEMGRKTGRTMSENASRNTIRLGLITDAKEVGSFTLEIEYIKFYTSK